MKNPRTTSGQPPYPIKSIVLSIGDSKIANNSFRRRDWLNRERGSNHPTTPRLRHILIEVLPLSTPSATERRKTSPSVTTGRAPRPFSVFPLPSCDRLRLSLCKATPHAIVLKEQGKTKKRTLVDVLLSGLAEQQRRTCGCIYAYM